MKHTLVLAAATTILGGCSRLEDVGRAPQFTPSDRSSEVVAMGIPSAINNMSEAEVVQASLWSGGRGSLLGDRRAGQTGDILTVVIKIDERAEISNASSRSRNGSEDSGVTELLGVPQLVDRVLPGDASLANAGQFQSSSSSDGQGTVRRNESLELKVAATVTGVLNNGVLRIQGSQEVRVNFEIRELLVTGYVRPEDVSRRNEITYDKIAAARISYGGRGQITDVQQPRYGQQIADIVLPF
ncbi:MAG: flagellar basal body L-ring protein FlgH [Silicimonas sp.]|nr:flagellar basal body L-ring protein FlgH [Silicimonas sp.]